LFCRKILEQNAKMEKLQSEMEELKEKNRQLQEQQSKSDECRQCFLIIFVASFELGGEREESPAGITAEQVR
jgi:hypothetical protein